MLNLYDNSLLASMLGLLLTKMFYVIFTIQPMSISLVIADMEHLRTRIVYQPSQNFKPPLQADFSWLCFHISELKLVGNFHMKRYRSSSPFVTLGPLLHVLLSSVQNSFSNLFLAMYSHILMKFGMKLLYGEFQIKFDFRNS